jgi:hydrogenase/urease accessory protein HupE
MSRIVPAVSAVTFAVLPSAANAHPGHGLETGLWHWVTDPFHLGVGLLIAVGVFAVLRVFSVKRQEVRRK